MRKVWFITLLAMLLLAENATVRNRLLINLSNHPYETWGDKQKNAANEYGEVITSPSRIPNA